MTLPALQPMLDQELRDAAEAVRRRKNLLTPIHIGEPRLVPERGEEIRIAYTEEKCFNSWVGCQHHDVFGIRTLLAVERAFYLRDPPTIIVVECG